MYAALLLALTLGVTPAAPVYDRTENASYYEIYPLCETESLRRGGIPVGVQTLAGTGLSGARGGESAQFNLPASVFSGADGGLLIMDTYNNLIRAVDESGEVNLLSGNIAGLDSFGFPRGDFRDGPLSTARFNRPIGGVTDELGRVFIADSENHAIRVIIDENVFTFAGNGEAGYLDGTLENARFNHPAAIAIGPGGSLFIADTLNHVIRRIDTEGEVTTVAGVVHSYGQADGAYDEAMFFSPMGIAVNADGVIFVADTGNHLIRVIEDGRVSTLAGTIVFPADVEWEDAEDADFDELPLGGFADGYEAMFNLPAGLAIWGNTLVVADSANHRIRIIEATGETFTLAGTGYPDYTDGMPDEAAFHLPRGVYVSGDTLYIADTGNNLIRVMALTLTTED